MRIEVVYALPAGEDAVAVNLPPGATAADAVAASGLGERHDLSPCRIGIYGKVVPPTARLKEGDRVEIYRPLAIDPKEGRRRRAGEAEARRRRARKKPT